MYCVIHYTPEIKTKNKYHTQSVIPPPFQDLGDTINDMINPLVIINHEFASVYFGTRLLISLILRLVHELHLAPTIFLLPLHVLKLIVSLLIQQSLFIYFKF